MAVSVGKGQAEPDEKNAKEVRRREPDPVESYYSPQGKKYTGPGTPPRAAPFQDACLRKVNNIEGGYQGYFISRCSRSGKISYIKGSSVIHDATLFILGLTYKVWAASERWRPMFQSIVQGSTSATGITDCHITSMVNTVVLQLELREEVS
eukprot:6201507-Pleurochrysis_carterae.AAC.6